MLLLLSPLPFAIPLPLPLHFRKMDALPTPAKRPRLGIGDEEKPDGVSCVYIIYALI